MRGRCGGESGTRQTSGDHSTRPRPAAGWRPKATVCAPSTMAARRASRSLGNDERGVLFGVGGLLRALEMRRDSVTLPGTLDIADGAEVRAARPPTGLPSEDELLRRVERTAVGELHPRSGRVRRQRDRADSAAFRRCGRQSAFSAASDGDDGGNVAAGAGVRAGRAGSGIRRWMRIIRTRRRWRAAPAGVGRGLPPAAAHRCGLRARAAIPVTPNRGISWRCWRSRRPTSRSITRRPRCGYRRRDSMRRGWSSSSDLMDQQPAWLSGDRLRAAGARQPAGTAAAHSQTVSDPLLSGHHALGKRGIHGERLGCGLCADRGAGGHQSAAAG